MKLVPYLYFAGNAEDALNFYANALNGTITTLSRYGESPMPCDDDYKEKLMNAAMEFNGNLIMVSDGMKGQPVSTNGNIQLSIDMPDAAQTDVVFNKLAEGGEVTMALQDTFWGAKFGMLKDKFGVGWMLNHDYKK